MYRFNPSIIDTQTALLFHLNTTHVSVQCVGSVADDAIESNLNTTHVSVQYKWQ